MPIIEFDKIGKIISGDEAGGYIKVTDDTANTGGYYILFCENIDFLCVFDSWVEDKENLIKYFEESNWVIEYEFDKI